MPLKYKISLSPHWACTVHAYQWGTLSSFFFKLAAPLHVLFFKVARSPFKQKYGITHGQTWKDPNSREATCLSQMRQRIHRKVLVAKSHVFRRYGPCKKFPQSNELYGGVPHTIMDSRPPKIKSQLHHEGQESLKQVLGDQGHLAPT